jgi:hypothetical protein
MPSSSATIRKYLQRRATVREFDSRADGPWGCAVVIPCYAEDRYLPETLLSLSDCPEVDRDQTLVLVVINQPSAGSEGLDAQVWESNRRTLEWLAGSGRDLPLRLAWIDAASPGRELPGCGGVGAARKLGCDSALAALVARGADLSRTLIAHLDADTLVEPDYLAALGRGLKCADAGVVEFHHRPAGEACLQTAIDLYEDYVRYYRNGLRLAGSPYAYHAIGSTMVSTAEAYARVGGVPGRRTAGEDFYFLQELAKFRGVTTIADTVVHPSPRPSTRVPFGTGPRMRELLSAPSPCLTACDPRVFVCLSGLFRAVERAARADTVPDLAGLEPGAVEFVSDRGIQDVWERFRRQFRTVGARVQAFHRWFDALATVRFTHHLTRCRYPEVDVRVAMAALPDEFSAVQASGSAVPPVLSQQIDPG